MFEFEFNELFRTYFQNSSDLISNLMFMNADRSYITVDFLLSNFTYRAIVSRSQFHQRSILLEALTCIDPKSAKKDNEVISHFTLLGTFAPKLLVKCW